MATRPSERRAVVQLLDQEHDDIEELATRIIEAIEELRSESLQWDVIVQRGAGEHVAAVSTYGPYSTQNAALGAIEGGLVALSRGDQWMLAPSGTAEYLERLKVRADVNAALGVPSAEQVRALALALNCTQRLVKQAMEVAEPKRRPTTDYVGLLIKTARELKRTG